MADLLGKEAAVFLPSGTMANEIAILVHCRPGDEILAHRLAHIYTSEGGAPWALAGVQVTGLPGEGGQFEVSALAEVLRPAGRNFATQRLVEVEQTANLGGGTIWPIEALRDIAELAHSHGMDTMMDGARLMNAVVASGIPAREMAAGYDSVWLDFTKGLGAPLGAVLAGSRAFIEEAWRWKQRLGGAMRQAGICAAACLYALDHHVDRLAEDHARAGQLARSLSQMSGVKVELPETNLVFFDVASAGLTAEIFAGRLLKQGILVSTLGKSRVRACLHLDIDDAGLAEAETAMRRALSE
jgi:threonine aldolase